MVNEKEEGVVAFKTPLWVGAGTEMRTQHLPAASRDLIYFFIYGYMASDIYYDKVNPLPPHGLLFPISSKRSFICTIPHTG